MSTTNTTSNTVSTTEYGPLATRFETRLLPSTPTAIAPDGSEVRVLLDLPRGGMAHFRLRGHQVARGVTHCTVEEIWYVVSGTGELWRSKDGVTDLTPLGPGTCVSIPLGTHFQFRTTSSAPLDIVGVTMPPWPGPSEAYAISSPWYANAPPPTEPLRESPPPRSGPPPTTRLARDHVVVNSPFCGRLLEILADVRGAPNIAIAIDIRPTTAHYHTRFTEIYFVLDGEIALRLYDPATRETTEHVLGALELCVIPPRVHHVIARASMTNRLCVLSAPGFDRADEHRSEIL
jgi:mannose-6-phosphate isomerase-like protein (cupin superfamily)